jgi:hypothetical protein
MRTTRYRSMGGGGGGSAVCTPTAVFADTFAVTDDLAAKATLFDTLGITEDLAVKVEMGDTVAVDDHFSLATALVDTFGMTDGLVVNVSLFDSLALTDDLAVVVKLFDTLGADDRLSLAQLVVAYVDTFGITDGLGAVVQLFDTLGVDDALSFVDISTTHPDTFGVTDDLMVFLTVTQAETLGANDALSFVDLFTVHPDTFGVDDAMSLVDIFTIHPDTFAVTENVVATVKPVYADTVGATENLFVDLFSSFTEDVRVAALPVVADVGTPADGTSDATGVTVLVPAGTQNGDLLYAEITAVRTGSTAPTITPPSGWTQVQNSPSEGAQAGDSDVRHATYYRIASSEPVSYTWTANGAATDGMVGIIRRITGHDPVNPVDTSAVSTGTDLTAEAPSLTTTVDRTLLLASVGASSTAVRTFASAGTAGLVEDYDNNTDPGAAANSSGAVGAKTSAGAVGTQVFTVSGVITGFGAWTVILAAIRPSVNTTLDDNLGVTTKLFDTFGVTENLIPKPKLFLPDTVGITDDFPKAQFRNWTCSRSASPDTDPGCDAWVDQANAGTNHGNESPLLVSGKSTLADDERRALLEFDFTRYANMTAFVGGIHQLTLRVVNTDIVLPVDLTVQLSRLAARPFTESTVTWNNQPAAGTVIKSEVFTLAANSTSSIVMTLTDAQMDDLLGDWGYVRLTSPSVVTPITIDVMSREDADLADKPRWDFDLKR